MSINSITEIIPSMTFAWSASGWLWLLRASCDACFEQLSAASATWKKLLTKQDTSTELFREKSIAKAPASCRWARIIGSA